MRMSRRQKVTAADLVNALNKGELYALFSGLAQENRARALAQAILVARRLKKIKTTGELTQLIKKVKKARSKIHPATKAFLALRIAVNDELNNLKKVLPLTVELLKTGGRLVILSYHSGEDRIVKYFFKKMDAQNILKTLTQKPIRPSPFEIKKNPASRSAKMRVAEKL
jgi:16S rRNA (cytosine1402-N4)-methyltransferase